MVDKWEDFKYDPNKVIEQVAHDYTDSVRLPSESFCQALQGLITELTSSSEIDFSQIRGYAGVSIEVGLSKDYLFNQFRDKSKEEIREYIKEVFQYSDIDIDQCFENTTSDVSVPQELADVLDKLCNVDFIGYFDVGTVRHKLVSYLDSVLDKSVGNSDSAVLFKRLIKGTEIQLVSLLGRLGISVGNNDPIKVILSMPLSVDVTSAVCDALDDLNKLLDVFKSLTGLDLSAVLEVDLNSLSADDASKKISEFISTIIQERAELKQRISLDSGSYYLAAEDIIELNSKKIKVFSDSSSEKEVLYSVYGFKSAVNFRIYKDDSKDVILSSSGRELGLSFELQEGRNLLRVKLLGNDTISKEVVFRNEISLRIVAEDPKTNEPLFSGVVKLYRVPSLSKELKELLKDSILGRLFKKIDESELYKFINDDSFLSRGAEIRTPVDILYKLISLLSRFQDLRSIPLSVIREVCASGVSLGELSRIKSILSERRLVDLLSFVSRVNIDYFRGTILEKTVEWVVFIRTLINKYGPYFSSICAPSKYGKLWHVIDCLYILDIDPSDYKKAFSLVFSVIQQSGTLDKDWIVIKRMSIDCLNSIWNVRGRVSDLQRELSLFYRRNWSVVNRVAPSIRQRIKEIYEAIKNSE